MNFEEKLKKLEQISETMKQDSDSLDSTIKSFEEGIKLVSELETELTSYEKKIEILLEKDGENQIEDFR